jgi:hypothetical protein
MTTGTTKTWRGMTSSPAIPRGREPDRLMTTDSDPPDALPDLAEMEATDRSEGVQEDSALSPTVPDPQTLVRTVLQAPPPPDRAIRRYTKATCPSSRPLKDKRFNFASSRPGLNNAHAKTVPFPRAQEPPYLQGLSHLRRLLPRCGKMPARTHRSETSRHSSTEVPEKPQREPGDDTWHRNSRRVKRQSAGRRHRQQRRRRAGGRSRRGDDP